MLTVEVLQEFSRRENLNTQISSVFQHYLALTNQVLSWNFLPPNLGRHYIAVFESLQNVLLKPTESWQETLLDSRVMELFFTCLAHLASLHGLIFPVEGSQVDYLTHFIEWLLNTVNGIDIEDSEAVGISSIINNLIAIAALEEVLDKDDMVYMEAYDKLLESWLALVQEDKHFHKGFFTQHACHLAAPDGTKNLTANGVASCEEEEINELQEDERDQSSDQWPM
ncbi:Exportin-4 [Plecturocebus cupreus]